MRIAFSGLMILLALPIGSAAAQQQQPPQEQQGDTPADAARRARDQKKEQAKPAKVWDNDNVSSAAGVISVVGQSSAAGGDGANTSSNVQSAPSSPGAGAVKKGGMSANDIAAGQAQLASAKARLQSLKADLDLLQRKFALDSQTYLSNPNHTSDKAGADAVADEQSQIDAKQQEVDAEQKKVDELNAKLKDTAPPSDSSTSSQN
jgi:hypothetical protein